MPCLALDLGTRTGWALVSPPAMIVSGVELFLPRRWEGGGMRYLRFRRWLDELASLQPFDEVVYEEVRAHQGVDAAHCYGGLLATLTAWCEGEAMPYQGVPVGAIKRHATGKGNAGKPAVVKAMEARGYHPADDNEADALALALFWLAGQATPQPANTRMRLVT